MDRIRLFFKRFLDLFAFFPHLADLIPRDDGDFYQFVYVSHTNQIRGASLPFQFKRAHLSDYVEVEEQGAIVYK